ncbi:MAG: hypothetical protein J6V82_00350, partial [Clostridia bacterium]|nr:hypothetical protein [Clostridia bacterium]
PEPEEPTEFTVTFVDGEGNTIATETVQAGANATLPDTDGVVYTFSPVDALYNITESKTITLGTLDLGTYTNQSFTTNKNQVVLGGGAQASSSAGTYLAKAGTSMTYTATMVGNVKMWYTATNGSPALQEGDYIALEVKVDGVVVNIIRVSHAETKLVTLCTLAEYAEHTIVITAIETNIPDAECDRNIKCARIYSLEYFVAQ